MTHRLGLFGFLIVGLFLTASCSGGSDDDEREAVDRRQQQMHDAVDGVVHDVAAATGIRFKSGKDKAVVCGYGGGGGGVDRTLNLYFEPPTSSVDRAVDDAERVLEAAGWKVERPKNPAIVKATNDELILQFQFGPAATNVSMRTSCVETSDDVSREYQDAGSTEVEWK